MVCQVYNLLLILRKAKIFPACFEFVGVNVGSDGNPPARSKHVLLETWPDLTEVRDIAKFIGFGHFHSQFIPNFEIRVAHLCSITCHEYTTPLGELWTSDAKEDLTISNRRFWTTLVFSALIIKS